MGMYSISCELMGRCPLACHFILAAAAQALASKLTRDTLPVQLLQTVVVELQEERCEPWNSASFLGNGSTGGPTSQNGYMPKTVLPEWKSTTLADNHLAVVTALPAFLARFHLYVSFWLVQTVVVR